MKLKYVLFAGVLVSGLNVMAGEQANPIDLSSFEPRVECLSPVPEASEGDDVSETAQAMAGVGLVSDDEGEEESAAPVRVFVERPSQVSDSGFGLGLLPPEHAVATPAGTMSNLQFVHALNAQQQPSPNSISAFNTWYDIVKNDEEQLDDGLSSYGKHKQFNEQISKRLSELKQQEKEEKSKRAASPTLLPMAMPQAVVPAADSEIEPGADINATIGSGGASDLRGQAQSAEQAKELKSKRAADQPKQQVNAASPALLPAAPQTVAPTVDAAPSVTEAARAAQEGDVKAKADVQNPEQKRPRTKSGDLPAHYPPERSWKPWIFGASIMAVAAAVIGYIWWLKHPAIAAR